MNRSRLSAHFPLLIALVSLPPLAACRGEPEIRTVEADRFVLRGSDGAERLLIESDAASGSPSLALLDAEGKKRAVLLLAGRDLPRLALLDDGEKERAA
ncbi:MAG: hypothetical protein JXA90_12315, partial [Planctomycetes bacterium]|nr:hypothetical protein [Planctomycetota bacterium]